MALDRVVRWTDERPSREALAAALRGYIGKAGRVRWRGDRWFVVLPGVTSWPPMPMTPPFVGIERWFEVWTDRDSIDVMTRMQDPLVNAVAEGFAAHCARRWRGKRDE